ncbi:MAG: 2,3-bisphosphoglycerate-independent phosphoglycerate mutase, partial [Angelakisella sp.]
MLPTNPALVGAVDNCLKNGTALHLCGLLSDGGVHSHNTHLYGLLELAKKKGLQKVFVHAFMDGRDVPPSSGKDFVAELMAKMEEIGVGKIATISGRYYAMDRDNRWERVSQAHDAMVNGKGGFNANPVDVMEQSYADGKTDEFVQPTVCTADAEISENDSVIFFNFRPDRAREITRTMVDPAFDGFARKKGYFPLYYVCMTQYDATMPNVQVAFKPQSLDNTFGAYIAEQGLSQLRIAETEKYAHVTFFFNGGVEAPCKNEDRALIPSPKVATYDMQPEMSAPEVTEEVLARLQSGKYDVIILNYANCDMVGHTGVFDAAVTAVETVDSCLGRTVAEIQEMGGIALIT